MKESWLINLANQNQGVVSIILFFLGLFITWISGLFKRILDLFASGFRKITHNNSNKAVDHSTAQQAGRDINIYNNTKEQ